MKWHELMQLGLLWAILSHVHGSDSAFDLGLSAVFALIAMAFFLASVWPSIRSN